MGLERPREIDVMGASARPGYALDSPDRPRPEPSSDPRGGHSSMSSKESKLKVGARVAVFGPDDPKGKGEIIGGPDALGNWVVRWDEKWDDNEGWDGDMESSEALSEEDVVA